MNAFGVSKENSRYIRERKNNILGQVRAAGFLQIWQERRFLHSTKLGIS